MHYDLDDPHAPPTSDLGGCIIVTTTSVYQCRQIGSPEAIFLDKAMSLKSHEDAEGFGVTFKLDVCGLYKVSLIVHAPPLSHGTSLFCPLLMPMEHNSPFFSPPTKLIDLTIYFL